MDNNKSVSTAGDEPASAEQGSKGVLKLGLDMHYRQVTVATQQEHGPIKAVGKLSHEGFWAWVEKKHKEGWQIYSCYEAGASGYWLHRDLVALGVKNQVVAPKPTGQDRRQKTDRRDSAELLDCLDQYLRGKKTALSPVAIPSPELEQNRALVRFHRQLMADRGRPLVHLVHRVISRRHTVGFKRVCMRGVRKRDSSATSFAFHGFFLKSLVLWLEPRMRSAFATRHSRNQRFVPCSSSCSSSNESRNSEKEQGYQLTCSAIR